tara:strand:+ start:1726 stop:1899 length:174 start_codon:yes stop_codon:yes gene_type:complete
MNKNKEQIKNEEIKIDERKVSDVRWVIDRYYWTVEDDCETADEVLGRIIQIVFPEVA